MKKLPEASLVRELARQIYGKRSLSSHEICALVMQIDTEPKQGQRTWRNWKVIHALINIVLISIAIAEYREQFPPIRVWNRPGFRWIPYVQRLRYLRAIDPVPIKAKRAAMPSPFAFRPATVHFSPMLEYQLPGTLDETTTTADPGTSGTSLAVTTRTILPQTGKFWILVQNSETDKTNREIMRVTGGQGTGAGSLTVLRGQEGTTGVAHPVGSYVAAVAVESLFRLSFQRGYVPDNVFYSSTAAAVTGAIDAGPAVNAAITACNTDGGGEVVIPGWCYLTATVITLQSNVWIRGSGMGNCGFVLSDTSASTPFVGSGATIGSTTNPSVAINIGDRSATMASITGFTVGDITTFIDNVNFRGWVGRVAAISGSVVTFEEKIPNDFPTTTGVNRASLVTKVGMRDLTITNPSGDCLNNTTRLSGAISLTFMADTYIDRVELAGISGDTSGQGILLERCRNSTLSGLRFERCGDGEAVDLVQNTRVIEPRNCTGVMIDKCHYRRSGASADLSFTGCNHVQVHDNVISGQTNWVGNNDWKIVTTGTPTGGTFTITVTPSGGGAVTTGTIPFNATAVQVQTAINAALTAPQSVVARGGPLPTQIAVAFSGSLDGKTGTLALGTNSLTGGTTPTVTFTQSNDTTGALSNDNGGRGCKFEIGNSFCIAANNTINCPGFDGFRCIASRHVKFIGNHVVFAHDVSFNIQDEGSGPCTDIQVIGNNVFLPSAGTGGQHGIYMSNIVRGIVANNELDRISATEGIYLNNTTTDIIIQGNIVNSTGFYGIRVGSGSSAAIRNQIYGNTIRSSVTNSINTAGTSLGGNIIYGNIIDNPVAIHAADLYEGERTGRLTADASKTTTAATDVTGLAFWVDASAVMQFEFNLFTSAGTGGIKFALTFPTGATVKAEVTGAVAAGAITSERITVSGTLTTAVFSTSNTTGWVRIFGEIRNSTTAGNVQLQYGSGTNAQNATVQADSYVVGRPLR